MKIVADKHIPFLEGVFEPYAEVVYIDGRSITHEDLIDAACELAESILIDCMARNMKDWNGMKTAVREGLRKYIYSKTKRNPIILPIFMEV